jgi:hypothetical protein
MATGAVVGVGSVSPVQAMNPTAMTAISNGKILISRIVGVICITDKAGPK